MSPEVLAEWFVRQGHRVVRTPSSWWYEASSRVYQAFPFHWSIRPREQELEGVLRARRALALRYSTPVDAPEGRVSYHAVCDDHDYALERLDGRVRNAVRNGLSHARIEPVPLERLAEEGWDLEADTCRRQGRGLSMSREQWRRKYHAAAALPGFEGWGALAGGRLTACMLCVRVDDWVEVLAQQCLAEFLPARVNNALTYTFTHGAIRRPGVRAIFYTLQSLDAPASVDEFKFRMGYVAVPVRQRVVLHPWVPRTLAPWAHRLVRGVLRRRPASRWLAKAEGMLRFRLEGALPAERQELPAVLQERKRHRAQAGPAARDRPAAPPPAPPAAPPAAPRNGEGTHDHARL